ncbi:MAG: hypothetical protein HY068_14140 [Burkholderiales bacterium]|nr:hypothetical protein [Burkholderiales bacterium]
MARIVLPDLETLAAADERVEHGAALLGQPQLPGQRSMCSVGNVVANPSGSHLNSA